MRIINQQILDELIRRKQQNSSLYLKHFGFIVVPQVYVQ